MLRNGDVSEGIRLLEKAPQFPSTVSTSPVDMIFFNQLHPHGSENLQGKDLVRRFFPEKKQTYFKAVYHNNCYRLRDYSPEIERIDTPQKKCSIFCSRRYTHLSIRQNFPRLLETSLKLTAPQIKKWWLVLPSLKLTASLHLEMDEHWKMKSFPFWGVQAYFQVRYISFREDLCYQVIQWLDFIPDCWRYPPFEDVFPIVKMVIFQPAMWVYQRVTFDFGSLNHPKAGKWIFWFSWTCTVFFPGLPVVFWENPRTLFHMGLGPARKKNTHTHCLGKRCLKRLKVKLPFGE